jgi:cysteine desulfurase
MNRIYLDHSATTPVRDEVAEEMLPYFSTVFGNASSIHSFGREARRAVQNARKKIAGVIEADLTEVVFTSGGTESDNLALMGCAYAKRKAGRHIITSSIEHPAVLNCCRHLEQEGFEVTYLQVDGQGLVDPAALEDAIRSDTVLVSIMLANNEVGTIQPIAKIGEITGALGIPLHTDAVQALGKLAVTSKKLNADLISMSGHKIYGPKGIGVLYIRKGISFTPLLHGGHHEMGFRPGTENVAAIVGLAKAMELAELERKDFIEKTFALRSVLEAGIKEQIENVVINGHTEKRLPNISNVSFKNTNGETMLMILDSLGVAVSTGSACSSGSTEPSHVLSAMGISSELASGNLRFSIGRSNDRDDIYQVLEVLPEIVAKLRGVS